MMLSHDQPATRPHRACRGVGPQRLVLGHSGRAQPAFGVGHRRDGGGLADRLGANRVRRRGGHLDGFQPRRPRHTAEDCSLQALWAPRRARRHWPSSSPVSAAAVPLRFLTGMFLAGVYPVGMKLMASWSESTDRGRTFGVLLGSAHAWLRTAASHQRPRAAAVENV